jgi:hypothetical protein
VLFSFFPAQVISRSCVQSFNEIWKGVKAKSARDWVRRCPGCWAECEVLPSAVYTADLLKLNLLNFRST